MVQLSRIIIYLPLLVLAIGSYFAFVKEEVKERILLNGLGYFFFIIIFPMGVIIFDIIIFKDIKISSFITAIISFIILTVVLLINNYKNEKKLNKKNNYNDIVTAIIIFVGIYSFVKLGYWMLTESPFA